ncbi:RNA-binding protein [Ectobacillus antri]|uniref:RNA-binding protein n=1 Tax=Ectobacillus antri TaxID=2486280 RepID=A0ABT6H266_9BACI|nr:RNA-binding protein [Ectobacillus antri]MDG4655851.1 RNA-binding protein [Ectobacillus antri]MDG5752526.1 RNA-binding protein [Ectobacillus antri]
MSIYDHFRPEEAVFVDRVIEWRNNAEQYYKMKLTDFLDPREQQIINALMPDKAVRFYGGADGTERRRALILPPYYEPNVADFQIEALRIQYAAKFFSIEHRQMLGALMSLGLKREKYGDIFIGKDEVYLFVAKEIADYIIMNLQSVGKAKIGVSFAEGQRIILPAEEWTEKSGTVSSLRVDALLAEMFNISRQKTQLLIKGGLVKVNWKVIEQPSYECFSGDVLSARGHGRAKILSIDGKSKRDKWKIMYGLLK